MTSGGADKDAHLRHDCAGMALHFGLSRSLGSQPYSSERLTTVARRGSHLPRSHALTTVWSTPIASATCCCVYPAASLRALNSAASRAARGEPVCFVRFAVAYPPFKSHNYEIYY